MAPIKSTNDPALRSWIKVPEGSDFPLQNLPFGIFTKGASSPRAATIIGKTVIDLYALARKGYLKETGIDPEVFHKEFLNDFISLGKPAWQALRLRLSELFLKENPQLRDRTADHADILFPYSAVKMHLPVRVGDYTDFYSSIEHATNVGIMFRDPGNALLPNWIR